MAEAKSRLWESGLNVGELIFEEGILAVERNRAKVYAQSVVAGEVVTYGSRITLYFTLDNDKVVEAVNAHEKAAQRAREVADSLANVEKEMLRQAQQTQQQKSETTVDEEFLY
jgi:peroxiredoxin family protein